MKMTKEERLARRVAQKLVDTLAQFETFPSDPEMILEDALILMPNPKYMLSDLQKHEIRVLVGAMVRVLGFGD